MSSLPINPALYRLHVEALGELKAIVDDKGAEYQTVRDVIYGLLEEIEALEQTPSAPPPTYLTGPYGTDAFGCKIYATTAKGGEWTSCLDVRGWGYLTGCGHGALGLSQAEATQEQARFAAWVVESLNAAHQNIA